MTFLFSDFGQTILAAPVTTTPVAGTTETWSVLSTVGNPPLPQITGGKKYPAVIYTADISGASLDPNPEIVLVTAINSPTSGVSVTVQRGYGTNGVVKTHSVGDVFEVDYAAAWANQLGSPVTGTIDTITSSTFTVTNPNGPTADVSYAGAIGDVFNRQTVSGTTYTIPDGRSSPYANVHVLTLTHPSSVITLPPAYNGLDVIVHVLQGSGGNTYSFLAASGGATAPSATSTTSAGQVDTYRFFALDGTDYNGILEGSTGGVVGALLAANNGSDVLSAGTFRENIKVPVLADCQAAATANVNIASPGATFDGQTLSNSGHDQVFLSFQSTTSQNGPWVWNGASSPLTRPTDFSTGLVLTTGKTLKVQKGTTYPNTLWALSASNSASVTVDTTAQTWAEASSSGAGGAVSSVFGRTGAVTAQSGDYTAAEVGALPSTDDLSAIATANATAGNISMNSHRLTSLAAPTTAGDALSYGGALGTPSSGVATNLTGTAAGLIAGKAEGLVGASLATISSGNVTLSATANICPVLVTATGHNIYPGRAPTGPGDVLIVTVTQNSTGGYAYSLNGFTGAAVYFSGASVSISIAPNAVDCYIGFPNEAGTDWIWFTSAEVVTGYLPIQEPATALATSGTITLNLPTMGNTVQVIDQTGAITLANPSTYPASGITVTFQLRIVTDSSHSVTFPTSDTRWGGQSTAGSAPTLAASATYDFVVKCLDGVHWDWVYTRFA